MRIMTRDLNPRMWKIRDLLSTWHRMLNQLRFLCRPFRSRNPKLVYRHQDQPTLESEAMRQGELIIDHEA